jgi:protein O-GlcNAc transferase
MTDRAPKGAHPAPPRAPQPTDVALMQSLRQAWTLHQQGKLAEAERLYREVLVKAPATTDAMHFLGVLESQRGNVDAGLAWMDRAIAGAPNNAAALYNRANVLAGVGRFADAAAGYDRVVAIKPDHAGAYFARGNTLMSLKRVDEAIASFDRAVQLQPGNVYYLNNRGQALTHAGRLDEALTTLDRAIAIDRNQAEIFLNRGNVLVHLKRYADAVEAYRRAIAIRPDYPESLSGLAYALTELKRHDEAIPVFERLLAIRPDYAYAPGMLIYAKTTACDWTNLDKVTQSAVAGIRAGKRVATPIAIFAVSDSPEVHAQCSRILMRDKHPGSERVLWRGEPYRHAKIRVAYVSADFNAHAVATLAAGMFEHHDRAHFEPIAISHGLDDGSALRARLTRAFDRFIDVRNKSDLEVATLIRQLGADIAVDLTGLTGAGRPGIFKFRCAPVQAQHLGFAGTMAADYYDYIIADRIVIPQESLNQYSEKVVYLPDTYLPNDDRRVRPLRSPTRAQSGLPDTGFVFASFNNSYKFSPAMFDIWMRLLSSIPGSVLWLPQANEAARRSLSREAEARGVPSLRLVFAAYAPREQDHLARLLLADLFLDTLPYNAHTTAADALWMGLPVLTTPGRTFPARVAASLLHAIGLPELIAPSLAEYERLALGLARDPAALKAIRKKLAGAITSAPLFNTARFTSNLEAAYITMRERCERGQKPESFAVAGPLGAT